MPSPDKLLVPAQTGNRFGTSRPLMATLTSFMKGAMEAVEDCPHSVSPGGAAGATAIILSSGGMVGLFNAGITIGSVVAFGLQHCSGENS